MLEHHPLVRPATDRFTTLLALLMVTLLVSGIEWRYAAAILATVNTAVLLVAFQSVGLASSYRRLVALVFIGVLGVISSAVFDPNESAGGIAWLIQAGILGAIAVVVAQRVLAHPRVRLQTIAGALCFYVLLGLVFGVVFGAIDAFTDEPVLFSDGVGRADPVYYSFVTLTTVGFGDVTSSLDIVRRITVIEAMLGQIFLATMVARLVSLYGVARSTGEPEPDQV